MQAIATYALRDIAEIAALGAFLIMIAFIARAIGSLRPALKRRDRQ